MNIIYIDDFLFINDMTTYIQNITYIDKLRLIYHANGTDKLFLIISFLLGLYRVILAHRQDNNFPYYQSYDLLFIMVHKHPLLFFIPTDFQEYVFHMIIPNHIYNFNVENNFLKLTKIN